MNKQLKEQLNKIKSTKVDFNDNSEKIVIPKTTKYLNESIKKDVLYFIELFDFIINPDINSTLASNWNNGKVPKYKYYKVELVERMGNMVKLNGIAVVDGKDILTESWYGWIPLDGFKIIGVV